MIMASFFKACIDFFLRMNGMTKIFKLTGIKIYNYSKVKQLIYFDLAKL